MRFQEAPIQGVYLMGPEMNEDERGFFARTFCVREFEAMGLNTRVVQCDTSFNKARGTLRGMHYQVPPMAEVKLVRCTMGAIYDVAVDLRADSPTYCQWYAAELTSENRAALYIPEGMAHGFQTLEDKTEVFYQMSEFSAPEYSRGVRWDDPAFLIEWPVPDPIVSEKDSELPDFKRQKRE